MGHHFITGRDDLLLPWAAARIPHVGSAELFGKAVAVGVATGPTPSDRLLAVIVFHNYYPQFGHCEISAASASPRWATRKTFRGLLSIPFLQYGCHLVAMTIPHKSERVLGFAKAIGFTREATLADRFGDGIHAVIVRMKRRDYDRLYWREGQKIAKAA